MKSAARCALALLLLAPISAQPALAFEYPLSPEAIREAYFLGKAGSGRQSDFFAKYTQQLPMPDSGPYVAWITFQTPFANIVDRVSHAPMDYHAQEAEQEFLGKPGVVRVRLEIDLTPTYPAPAAPIRSGFWRDFKVHLMQRAEIHPRSVRGEPIYNDETLLGFTGATLRLDYGAKGIDPDAPATVVVDTPDGQHVTATFDLAKLR